MRKALLLLATLAFLIGESPASPIDVNRAKSLGLKFMQHNSTRQVGTLDLAYTQLADNGMTALYVFNAENGFVVVSADDVAQPILGYSDEGVFDASNLPDGLAYYLRFYARQIEYAVENQLEAEPEVTAQWARVAEKGLLYDHRDGRGVGPLLTTEWNQDYPYNYYAPTGGYSYTGGHCYAGCLATAMSQVMKYWNWPDTGTGEHTYSTSTYGGTLSANFGETTYQWSIMPPQLGYYADNAAKAVALLMYHCGVAVEMDYKPTGSGAHPIDVSPAVKSYFKYASCTNLKYRDAYSKTEWEDMLIESFDKGYPVIYSGTDANGTNGHAFNCDGYNNQRLFHFNWGWSGDYNSYYAVDALNVQGGNHNYNQSVVFDMIPDYIYNALIPAVANLSVEVNNAHTKTGVISWTNPSLNYGGEAIENIEKVVLLRNNVEIFSQQNVTPGETMTFQDQVPDYNCYTYTVYCLSNGVKGDIARISYQYGPTCTWKIIGQTTNFQGWNGSKLQLLNSFGAVVDEITMVSSTPMSRLIRVPEGEVSFKWVPASNPVSSVTINIKNEANTSVYTYSGPSSNLDGVLTTLSNDCNGCQPPTGLYGEYHWIDGEFGTLLTWSYDNDPQSFKVYRSANGVDYAVIATVNKTEREYFDATDAGTYYYKVTAYRSSCESTPAWASDDQDYVHVDVTSVMEADDCVKVYPNPAHSMLCVEAEGLEQIAIFNVMGQAVYQQPCSEDGVVVNTASLPAGVYFISLKTPKATTTKRFSVAH